MPAILETGFKNFHFGAPAVVAAGLAEVPSDAGLCGNLDPAGSFCQSNAHKVKARAADLLAAVAHRRSFVLASGCDLPPNTPLDHLDTFFAVAKSAPPFSEADVRRGF